LQSVTGQQGVAIQYNTVQICIAPLVASESEAHIVI